MTSLKFSLRSLGVAVCVALCSFSAAIPSVQAAETTIPLIDRYRSIPAGVQFPYADPANQGWTQWTVESPLLAQTPEFWNPSEKRVRMITADLDFNARPLVCARERWAVLACFRGGKQLSRVNEGSWEGIYVEDPRFEPFSQFMGSSIRNAMLLEQTSSGANVPLLMQTVLRP